ncbi:hypothetical protein KDK_57470 [Dictyobacter kobayashii]|uniref:Uncharacterized protein n=1 Tax=Dictyobacter kobayashii TaxID=2014872 RepID=A0A402AS73_9CHLR|nr:hypothetical protein KDK_57470 [Dictyobacter kobayashii]
MERPIKLPVELPLVVELPVFHVACIEKLFDEIEKSPILDVFASAEMMRLWSREPKQSAMSPSMIQTVPCQFGRLLGEPYGILVLHEAVRVFAECPIEVGI